MTDAVHDGGPRGEAVPRRGTALQGFMKEECGSGGGWVGRGSLSDLQITNGTNQIGLIREHAHARARGKATPGAGAHKHG